MTKQTITTEIEVPDGYGFVRIGRAKRHDVVVDDNGNPYVAIADGNTIRPIFRKAWQWPEWLKAPWIAMDESGDWFAYKQEPTETHHNSWVSTSFCVLNQNLLDWNPPFCDYWRKSKRKNPRLESNDE